MMTPKKKYAKPTVKVAKWELNEAICDDPVCLSYTKCLDVQGSKGESSIEFRDNPNGWSRVPSSNRFK